MLLSKLKKELLILNSNRTKINIKNVLNKFEVTLLEENPINKESKTILMHSKSSKKNVKKFIEIHLKDQVDFKNILLSNLKYFKKPFTISNEISEERAIINLGFSNYEYFQTKYEFLFYPKSFKNNFNDFCFYHELAHTSKYQRSAKNALQNSLDLEAHSDFFGIYFILSDLIDNSQDQFYFLKGHNYLRNNSKLSPKNIYSYEYSNIIDEVFYLNLENIDFSISYEKVDYYAFNFITLLKKDKAKALEYFKKMFEKNN
jgi:hypothetical protein